MALRLIYKQDLPSFLESLKAYGELVGPVRKNGGFVFARIDAIEEMASDHPITITPPKKYFFPQTETLFRFKTGEEVSIEPTLEAPRRIIFGIHPCDIHATWLLDQAFSDHVPDTYYLQKRERAIIIGMDCLQPCDEYSFCRSMGTFTVESGFDLLLTDINDAYAVQTGSIEGEGLLLRWGKDKEAVYERRNRLRAVQREKEEKFPSRLDFDVENLPRFLEDSYDTLLWDVLGEKCLACGSCTLACPTCYCFNVFDEMHLNLREGERKRQWDSCQLEDFAKVATGENFRDRRADRQRHRFFRKGKYLKERYGKFACVGCGRCARACLVKINPIEVYNQLKGGER